MNRKGFFSILLIGLLSVFYYLFSANEVKRTKHSSIKETVEEAGVFNDLKFVQTMFYLPAFGKHQIIEHKLYSLSYNEKHEQADWVAYKLFPSSINQFVKRKDNFRIDTLVVTGSASINDYKKSGFDRGHLAPAKTMSFSEETMRESFLMSNMSPQKPGFNRGIWKRLEERVRSWIPLSDSLYIVTGPVLRGTLGVIGKNEVTVPGAYYKTILRFKNGNLFGIGFLLKNEKSSKSLASYAVSIDRIEKLTGLNFYQNLRASIQDKIEANSNLSIFLNE